MNKYTAKAVQFAKTHRSQIAVGVVVGAIGSYAYTNKFKSLTLLNLPPAAVDLMKATGDSILYPTDLGDFVLKYIPNT